MKDKFTITYSYTNIDDNVTAQCEELGVWAKGNSKKEAWENLRIKIKEELTKLEKDTLAGR
jgi:predicted RNase H-like HicB family nuclease